MRVLFVATDLRDADILQKEVRRAAPKLTFDVCSGSAEARARTEKALSYDVMLLDAALPEHEQLQLVQQIRTRQLPLPIVLLGAQGKEPSTNLISAADDCLTRGPRLAERLFSALRLAIERYRVVATAMRDNDRLKRSEARLRLIIEALPAGVVLVDNAGKILAMNVAGASLMGSAGPADVVGRDLFTLADDDGAQLREFVGRVLSGERGRVEFNCLAPDGVTRALAIEGLCIQREANGQSSLLGVLSAAEAASTNGAQGDAGVEFAFGGEGGGVDERTALEQALEVMRGQVERLESEVAAERAKGHQVLAELERARGTAAEHHAQRTGIEERCQSAEARVAELESQQMEQLEAIESLGARYAAAAEELTALRQQHERVDGEAGALRQDLHEQRQLRLELEARAAAADGEAGALRQELHEQRRLRLELEERAAATSAELNRLNAQLADAQTSGDARLAALDAEVRELTAAAGAAAAREQALTSELEAARTESARVSAQLAETRTSAEARLAEADARLTEATARLTAADRRLAEADGRLAEADGRLAEADVRLAELEAEVRTLAAAADATAAHEHALVLELEKARVETAALHTELKAERDRRARLDAEIERVRGEMTTTSSEASQQLSAARQRLAEVEPALAARVSEVQAIGAQLEAARQEASRVLGELTRESGDRSQLQVELEAKGAEIARLVSTFEAERTALQSRTAQLQGELEAAQQRARSATSASEQHRLQLEARVGELERQLDEREEQRAVLAASIAEIDSKRHAAVARVAELEERRRDEQNALTAASQRETTLAQELQTVRDELARLTRVREALDLELTRERDTRRSIEDELTVKGAEIARVRTELTSLITARETELNHLLASREAELASTREEASRKEAGIVAAREEVSRLETQLEGVKRSLEGATGREATLATQLSTIRGERDARSRELQDVEAELAREREAQTRLEDRIQALERESADAAARADVRVAELERDHQDAVARLQKLLEQAAAREAQAAVVSRSNPADRGRRRPQERIGQLASAMAADLNTTVGAVAEDARKLLAELPEGTPTRSRAEQALQTANRAGQLVRHLLRLSERDSRLAPKVDVSTVVRTNEPLLRQLAGTDIDLRFELGAGLPQVEFDTEDVVQVLTTLVVTARSSLPLGGVIRVSTQERPRNEGRRRSDQALVLAVTAEGYGMVPVPTAACEEVITRCGGVFSVVIEPNASTALCATLPTEAKTEASSPGLMQSDLRAG